MSDRIGDLVEIRREWWCNAERGVCVPRHDIVDPDPGLGDGKVTQVAECRVGGESVLVVHAYSPLLSESERLALAKALRPVHPHAALAIVLASEPGHAVIDPSLLAGSAEVARAARAVAVVMASWGWDEERPARIDCAERALRVLADYDGAWRASLVD